MTSLLVKDQVYPEAYWITRQIQIHPWQQLGPGVPHIVSPCWAELPACKEQGLFCYMVPNATLPNYFALMRKELNEHISTHVAQPLRLDMCCMRIIAVISGPVLKKSHCWAIGCESRKLLWLMALLRPCNNSKQRAAGAHRHLCVRVCENLCVHLCALCGFKRQRCQ